MNLHILIDPKKIEKKVTRVKIEHMFYVLEKISLDIIIKQNKK